MTASIALLGLGVFIALAGYGLHRLIMDQVILYKFQMEKKRLEYERKRQDEAIEKLRRGFSGIADTLNGIFGKRPFPPGGIIIEGKGSSALIEPDMPVHKPPQPCFNGLCGCNEADICTRGLSPDSCEFNRKINKNENSH